MKYCLTTLAIGEEFESAVVKMFSDFNSRTTQCDYYATTMNSDKKIDNNFINWNVIEPAFNPKNEGGYFYYNLKSLALKNILAHNLNSKEPYEFIIFIDGDMFMCDDFAEQKFIDLFNYMNENNIDMVYERPGTIGSYKQNLSSCFFMDKIIKYNVMSHNKWDDAHVMNEQFMVFKYNWKFMYFVQRWEQFLWYSIKNNIINFAEGFEMGISALESDMNIASVSEICTLIRNCFYFFDSNGKKYIRY